MTSSRIEAYISIDNLSRLEAIRVKLDYKGYSKIVDEIFNKYFENISRKDLIDRKHNSELKRLNDKIRELEYELRNKELNSELDEKEQREKEELYNDLERDKK